MAAELFGVKEWNPLVLSTTFVLGAVALLAAALPRDERRRGADGGAARGVSQDTDRAMSTGTGEDDYSYPWRRQADSLIETRCQSFFELGAERGKPRALAGVGGVC